MCADTGKLGRLAGLGVRQGRQHPAVPAGRCRRAVGEVRVRHRLQGELAAGDHGIEAAGGKPYTIPAGASDHRLGGLGFANWAFEVAEQERHLGVFFDTIVVCSVTGSTQAGMVAGFATLGGRPRRILGIDASAKPKETRDQVARIARATASLIGLDRELTDEEIVLDERYHAGTYGIPDGSTMDAMRLAARTEGMITDPVYEGKSMAGLIDLVTRDEIAKDSTVLYAHLGGQPALNAYSALVE
jgi:1-aminocyclopropane-1-carboxylate deaminase